MEAPQFAADKARVLGQVDLSRKGSVDAAIAPLLEYINGQDSYYSTSSCAGRLVVFATEEGERKRGCRWLLVSHDPVELPQLESVLSLDLPERGYVYFKFEPFVLHVVCSTLEDARLMLQVAVGAGFRNSGLSCGRREKWMVAVRSTHSLEAPLSCDGAMIASPEYCRHMVDIGNRKLRENLERVQKFFSNLRKAVGERGTQNCESRRKHERKEHPSECRALARRNPDTPRSNSVEDMGQLELTQLFSGELHCS